MAATSNWTRMEAPPPPSSQEEVLFSLTERLRECESELRAQEERLRRGANEELLLQSHLHRREEEFLAEAREREERQREVERENQELKDALASLDSREGGRPRTAKDVESRPEDELGALRRQLDAVMGEREEKDRQVMMLDEMVNDLTTEAERLRAQEDEDKELLARLGERVQALRAENEELRRRWEKTANEAREAERRRDRREDELVDEIERLRRRHVDFADAQGRATEEREEELSLLYAQCEKYERVLDEAEHVTHQQRADLRSKKGEIESLSLAIERSQTAGILGRLDTLCSSSRSHTFVGAKSKK